MEGCASLRNLLGMGRKLADSILGQLYVLLETIEREIFNELLHSLVPNLPIFLLSKIAPSYILHVAIDN